MGAEGQPCLLSSWGAEGLLMWGGRAIRGCQALPLLRRREVCVPFFVTHHNPLLPVGFPWDLAPSSFLLRELGMPERSERGPNPPRVRMGM